MKDCVEWTGGKDSHGYGVVCVNGKRIGAHQLALILKIGRAIRPTMEAMHLCNNPGCVNPNHLKEGTHTENMRYVTESGRKTDLAKSRVVNNADRYSVDQVLLAKKLFSANKSFKEIQKATGISYKSLQNIKYGKTWKYLE